MKLQINMKPLEPYFLGGERCAPFGEYFTQRSLSNPYFLRSNQLPSQSALFGVLRYLGIDRPKSDFSIEDNTDNIGEQSFHLLSEKKQSFGRIFSIGPLMLVDKRNRHYLPVPKNHKAVSFGDEKERAFSPYQRYTSIQSEKIGTRWIPEDYKEKDRDEAAFLCIETGMVIGSPFRSHVNVGINRNDQRRKTKTDQSGFFKKEYVLLDDDFSFFFEANVSDTFQFAFERVVKIGQGNSPFFVTAKQTNEDIKWISTDLAKCCFPEEVILTGEADKRKAWTAFALSDLFFSGDIGELKAHCRLMLAGFRDYRVFTTNYKAKSSKERYQKHREALRLITAGSVFLFSEEEQLRNFKTLIEQDRFYENGVTAGFNNIYFSNTSKGEE